MASRFEQRIYEFEGFRLDAVHSMLYRNGQEIPLPPKAVETLLALVERRGEIVSTDELMEIIWADSIVEESNLSQYLHLLRKTLGARSNATPFIETLRRRGYRFTADVSCVKSAATAKSISTVTLIGREKEIATITEFLVNDDLRLVTLTGVGGVGKTTLARAVACCVDNDFADGVSFVELAAVIDPELVVSTIASVLGVKESGGKPIFEMLKDNLRDREMLLILDNFEQVVAAAPYISKLLAAAEKIRVLITSRVPLHFSVEQEFVVPPLTVPSDISEPAPAADAAELIDELSMYEAVRLFEVRARDIKPQFELTNDNARSVAEICARLDGLPLAIELAAARVKLMSPVAILDRLQSQLKLLTGGAKDLPERQQTMRGTVEWSYKLLDEDEKTLFRRLSVFAGSFTIEAAEAVCGWQKAEDSSGSEVLDTVTSLTDKSLLVSRDQRSGDVRFRMLEVVREYALESLKEQDEWDVMRRRHAEYFRDLGEEAEPHLQAARSAEWLNRLEDEHDNLRAALRWAEDHDAELGQCLSGAIWRFWWLHGHIREGCEKLAAFLSILGADDETRAKMLSGAGALNRLRGDSEMSRLYAEEALALARQTGDKKNAALSLHQLGFLVLDDADFAEAERLFKEGLTFAQDLGDKQILGLLYNGLGEISRLQEDYAQAVNFYRLSLEFNRDAGDRVRQTTNLINLGATALLQKDLEAAGSFYRDGLKISSKMADMNGTLYCLEGVAGAYWAVRKPETAALLYGASEALRTTNNLFIEPADRLPYEQSVKRVRDSLTEKTFNDLFAVGSRMKLEEAVALALSETGDERNLQMQRTQAKSNK